MIRELRVTGRRAVAAARCRLTSGGADRGANPVELAVVMPAILLLLFGSIQVAAWFLARGTAMHAAQSGVNAQRVHQAPEGAGAERADAFLAAAGDWLAGAQSSCVTGATEVTCTVTGTPLSLVPGMSLTVSQTAHGTLERWTTAGAP